MITQEMQLEDAEQRIRGEMVSLRQQLKALGAQLGEVQSARERRPRIKGMEGGPRLVAAMPPAREELAPRGVPAWAPKRAVNPRDALHRSPRGAALFAADPDEGEVVLLVRSDSEQIAALGDDPGVEFRAGLFMPAGTSLALVPILFRVGAAGADNLYEAWADESGPGLSATMAALAEQPYLPIGLYGDDLRLERVLRVPNPLRTFAKQVLVAVPDARAGSPDAVHQVRQAIYKQHPTARSLWRALKG